MNESEPAIADEAEASPPVLGIVCALNLEIAPFLKRTVQFRSQAGNGFTFRACRLNDTRICVVEGGAGAVRATRATNALIDAFSPPWVISVGFCGALVEGMRLGDIVVANSVLNESGSQRLAIDLKMAAAPEQGLHVGAIATKDEIVRLVDDKRRLANQTGAIAVDMESLAIAQVCRDRQTKFMAIRVISDDMTENLPPEVLAILGPKGTIRAGALVGSILKRPGCVKDLWALREKAADASERLAAFLPGVIKTLARTLPTTD